MALTLNSVQRYSKQFDDLDEAVSYYTSLCFTWWDFDGMIIQDPKIGGIDPNSCHPIPRPTTLAFFRYILISVPKTKAGSHFKDRLKY